MTKAFSLLITGAPTESACHAQGVRFAEAALSSGYRIEKVFFYQAGVAIAFKDADWPVDETNWQQRWLSLAACHGFPLEICVAAAARRGLSENLLAKSETNLPGQSAGFEIVGLGQLAMSMSQASSRLIHFR